MKMISEENIIRPNIEESIQALCEWRKEVASNYQVKSICQLFEEQAAKQPNHIALEYKNEFYTYQALDEITNRLARHIRHTYFEITKKPLTYDTLIPISIKRSADYIIGILSILKAGAAYVPINPEYPESRIQFILSDIKSSLILTTHDLAEKYSNIEKNIHTILLGDNLFLNEKNQPLDNQVTSNDLAYVIYTSGSTGIPKGVLAQHSTVVSQVICASYFQSNSSDTMTFFSDVSFDSTTFEIWGALLNGAKLFIPDNLFELLSNPAIFKKTIKEKNITIVLLTRALFDLLFTLDETAFEGLKFLLIGGEALTKNIMLKLFNSKHKPQHLINAYGPTENSTFCTTYEILEDFSIFNSVPIGKPYSNRIAYVVDQYLQLLPVGIAGEIYVGGSSMSRGYLNQPELTQERFIANPFFHNHHSFYRKIYKTGDLARWLPNGSLEYIGRNDFQVKLRGFRIELGEIETKLLEFPQIKHSVVLLKQNHGLDYLIGYYVADKKIDENSIREHLQTTLPDYMIPSVFQHLETLPVTTNGKLDRNSLPEPKHETEINQQDEILQPVEKTIASIWCKVLNIRQVGRDVSFFNLGGNSLAAMMVRNEIENFFGIKINIVELFQYTTIKQLGKRITALTTPSEETSIHQIKMQDFKTNFSSSTQEPVAVVGMFCRIPGINDPESFWELLLQEKSNLRDFSVDELRLNQVPESCINDDSYVKRNAILEDRFSFDASFFGYSAKEAEIMDPQQRHFLQCAWEALEFSGNVPDKFMGDIGVFASQGPSHYYMDHVHPNQSKMSSTQVFQATLGNEKDFLSTRVSYKLNLTGPSITLQTACSSSLVSIQMACESLKANGCDMALAGGVSLFYKHGYTYQEEMIESPDGYCRAFDAKAKGTVVTSGVGVVVLKRLSDAIEQNDTIYAVIKGGAINNDGSSKIGFTAPSVKGQIAVIERALKTAGVSPESIDYIEAHGTGTPLGDPIEWSALHQVYQKYTDKKEFCTIGSVKTNIGHTDSAAGVMGFIKTVLALKHQTLPATLNFETLNPEIASFNTLFQVSNKTKKWETSNEVRRAAVSSFGLGGTNAHVILEEYIENKSTSNSKDHKKSVFLIPFSAKNRESLVSIEEKLKQDIQANPQLALEDYAFTAQQGRSEFNERGFLICKHLDNIGHSIQYSYRRETEYQEDPSIIFVLSDLSIDSRAAFNNLYKEEPILKNAFEACSKIILENYGLDIETALDDNNRSHYKLIDFSIQYALAKLLISFNVSPVGLVAKGSGIYAAIVLAGIFSLEAAIHILWLAESPNYTPAKFANFQIHPPVLKLFSFKENQWINNIEAKSIEFWLDFIKSSNSLNQYSLPAHGISAQIFVEFGKQWLIYEHASLVLPLSEDGSISLYHTLLNVIGQLWSNGCSISWDPVIKSNHPLKKIRIPTYCFTNKHYKLADLQNSTITSAHHEPAKNNVLTEQALKDLWVSILGVTPQEIGESTHFFDLGGDSLALIDLFSTIKKSFIPGLNLEDIIEYNKFGDMSKYLLNFSNNLASST